MSLTATRIVSYPIRATRLLTPRHMMEMEGNAIPTMPQAPTPLIKRILVIMASHLIITANYLLLHRRRHSMLIMDTQATRITWLRLVRILCLGGCLILILLHHLILNTIVIRMDARLRSPCLLLLRMKWDGDLVCV